MYGWRAECAIIAVPCRDVVGVGGPERALGSVATAGQEQGGVPARVLDDKLVSRELQLLSRRPAEL